MKMIGSKAGGRPANKYLHCCFEPMVPLPRFKNLMSDPSLFKLSLFSIENTLVDV